ncbi:hypothetical protein B0H16DRAFT_1722102 [Mycena metata]|uniref:Uncharacterized protein n=1 Tax=Mycena metata TaxID=1033252 RepID=A0AAD7J692_9AGAR|nr:hypothetical protein B0H16DRAFT_1722102 [Mycena metata]
MRGPTLCFWRSPVIQPTDLFVHGRAPPLAQFQTREACRAPNVLTATLFLPPEDKSSAFSIKYPQLVFVTRSNPGKVSVNQTSMAAATFVWREGRGAAPYYRVRNLLERLAVALWGPGGAAKASTTAKPSRYTGVLFPSNSSLAASATSPYGASEASRSFVGLGVDHATRNAFFTNLFSRIPRNLRLHPAAFLRRQRRAVPPFRTRSSPSLEADPSIAGPFLAMLWIPCVRVTRSGTEFSGLPNRVAILQEPAFDLAPLTARAIAREVRGRDGDHEDEEDDECGANDRDDQLITIDDNPDPLNTVDSEWPPPPPHDALNDVDDVERNPLKRRATFGEVVASAKRPHCHRAAKPDKAARKSAASNSCRKKKREAAFAQGGQKHRPRPPRAPDLDASALPTTFGAYAAKAETKKEKYESKVRRSLLDLSAWVSWSSIGTAWLHRGLRVTAPVRSNALRWTTRFPTAADWVLR